MVTRQNGKTSKAKTEATHDDTRGEADLVSPLAGKSLGRVVVTVMVAIAVPGGLYLLAALVLAPLVTRYLLRRAEQRQQAGELKAALRNANRAVRLSRKSPTALAYRGLVHIEAGDIGAALADTDEAIKRKPNVALPYYVRALAHEVGGNAEAARADYVDFLERAGEADESRMAHAQEREAALGG